MTELARILGDADSQRRKLGALRVEVSRRSELSLGCTAESLGGCLVGDCLKSLELALFPEPREQEDRIVGSDPRDCRRRDLCRPLLDARQTAEREVK